MTIATMQMYTASGKVMYEWLIIAQVIGLIVLVVYLFGKTLQLAVEKKLCVKD